VTPDFDQTETTTGQPIVQDSVGAGAADGSSVQERAVALANDRPEIAAGAAFGGGLILAMILKRLAR
jgi:hypothetical protein